MERIGTEENDTQGIVVIYIIGNKSMQAWNSDEKGQWLRQRR